MSVRWPADVPPDFLLELIFPSFLSSLHHASPYSSVTPHSLGQGTVQVVPSTHGPEAMPLTHLTGKLVVVAKGITHVFVLRLM